ncbi:unnamed protein product, partial [Closterium sp. NIES-54]
AGKTTLLDVLAGRKTIGRIRGDLLILPPILALFLVPNPTSPHVSAGAGKTTLLDVLAGRKTIGRIRGDILVNSFPKVHDTFARISGYVEQSDIHTPFITIRESLQFSASLRLPATTSRAERALVVQEELRVLSIRPGDFCPSPFPLLLPSLPGPARPPTPSSDAPQAMDLLELHDIADSMVGFIGINEAVRGAGLSLSPPTPPAIPVSSSQAMDLLELHDIADTLVGFIGINGLSVEQAKRLTIGVELVANPSVLFLDEPTSGLDSRAADIVVRGIRNIAATGRRHQRAVRGALLSLSPPTPPATPLSSSQAMDLLELHDIADTLVGFIGINGLSVEQAKRLTIGVELVANPSVLFLDEPTSGLDSRAADIVVRGIRNIAATGRSTICTIHQPSRRLFFAFDWLYLMKRGGEVVYFGPIGHNGCDLLNYFESLPGLPKCRDDQNPATYMLEMIGAGIGHAAMRDFALDYAESVLAADNQEQLDAIRFGRGEYGPEPTVKGYAATWGTMTRVVFLRQVRTYWRNVSYSFGRIIFSTILGLILGSAFWQINYTTTPGFASRQGLIYVALVFVAVVNANNVIPQVNAEQPVYYREKASNMYSQNVGRGVATLFTHFPSISPPLSPFFPQVNAERPVYYREKASNMYSAFLYNLSWGLIE